MTDAEKIVFKARLKAYCIAVIEERISNALFAMQQAQEAANEEEKSSAGDKYETSRAMNQLDKDMHAGQLMANRNELAGIIAADCTLLYKKVSIGSVVICEGQSFFIAAGLGKVIFEGQHFYMLSQHAPILALLLDKKTGDEIHFSNKTFLVKDIY